jgi:hypothetical protein
MRGGNATEIKQRSELIYEVYAIPNVICGVHRSAKDDKYYVESKVESKK